MMPPYSQAMLELDCRNPAWAWQNAVLLLANQEAVLPDQEAVLPDQSV